MRKYKLSSAQYFLIERMSEGWELGKYYTSVTPSKSGADRYKIQKGGLGSGGETVRVSEKTVYSLVKLNIIQEITGTLQPKKYQFTDFGKTFTPLTTRV